MKHTFTVLEPLTPFHTLVKLVDAEDIANDKIRTHDLALEVNNITKQLQTQTLDSSNQEQLMFTQPRDPNIKNKPANEKYCSHYQRTNDSSSACLKKQRDDNDKREAYARSKSPQKSFVQYFRSLSTDRTKQYDTRYRSRSKSQKIFIITKTIIPTQDIVLHLEIDSVMTKIPLLHNTHDHDMAIINEVQDLTDHLTGHHTDLLIDAILVPDTDHVHIHTTITFNGILLHSDHFQDRETLDLLDHGHIHILEINVTQLNLKHGMIRITSKNACITLLKWLKL